MQISSSLSSVSGYSAMSSAFGAQNMDEMDSKVSADIFKAKDADKSGTLSASELGVSQSNVAEFDTDGDGVVSSAELTAGLKAKREKMQASMQNEMQQSGQMGLLQASMGQGMQGLQGGDMSKMDTKMSKKIISEKDTNKDGVLSASELGASAANFSKVDTDGDGSVSESELTASLKAKRENMMAENGGKMPPPPGSAEGAGQSQGTSQIDSLISSLFGDKDDTDSSSSDSTSINKAKVSSLSEYLKRQKASTSYMNMDKLIGDLFGNSDDTQSVSVSA